MASKRSDIAALIYHDLFDFPLTTTDLRKWQCNYKLSNKYKFQINTNKSLYFLNGKESLIKTRLQREKYSQEKLKIAKRAAGILAHIPTVKMIGITGSVAMNNAKEGSDIDFLIITTKGALWTTRLLVYIVCSIAYIAIRKQGDRQEKNKLCLNMWMDEGDLIFKKRNIYTAHELAQIVPLVNKNKTYEKLIAKNKWIFDYWPRALAQKYRVSSMSYVAENKKQNTIYKILNTVVENLAFFLQKQHMKSKRSREVITPTRAFFHPFDWGAKVVSELERRGLSSTLSKKSDRGGQKDFL